ncbi:hypothetical protein [Sphaerothrix gracilis]|uniref:hypothetical protein n=1 Tax=Sphaerothrix gracilis TaxID=3151835 RepID=UPI0031FD2A5E
MENVSSETRCAARSRLWIMLCWFLLAETILLALMAGAIVLTAMGTIVSDRASSRTASPNMTFPK